jgi:hypothetical protein
MEMMPGQHSTDSVQKNATIGTSHIRRLKAKAITVPLHNTKVLGGEEV